MFVRIEFIKRQFSIEIYTIEMDTIFSISYMTTFVGQWQKCSLLPEYQWTLIENPGKLTNRIYMIIWQQNPSTLYLGLILIIERFWQKYEHTNGTTRRKSSLITPDIESWSNLLCSPFNNKMTSIATYNVYWNYAVLKTVTLGVHLSQQIISYLHLKLAN